MSLATGHPPAVPEPDDKDWTWVLERPCLECGSAPAEIEAATIAERVESTAARWRAVLGRPDATRRPQPEVWSPLEYGCHVRDGYRIFGERARLMLDQDVPTFANWDQDETAIAQRYWAQDPDTVAAELETTARYCAAVFGSVTGPAWQRRGERSNGSSFTVETLGRYFLHDVYHHLHDTAG